MKVKVLHYLNGCDDPSEYGQIMDTFVFRSGVDLEKVKETVQRIWDEHEGEISYHDIVTEHFGKDLLDIVDSDEVVW